MATQTATTEQCQATKRTPDSGNYGFEGRFAVKGHSQCSHRALKDSEYCGKHQREDQRFE